MHYKKEHQQLELEDMDEDDKNMAEDEGITLFVLIIFFLFLSHNILLLFMNLFLLTLMQMRTNVAHFIVS